MKQAMISVIIPAYNVEKYIEQCLDSLFKQTFQDFEIIVVNDGSTDQTAAKLKIYQEKYSGRLTVFHQENQGQSSARNKALSHVTGKYILFMDADDYVLPDYMETLVTTAEKEEADLVICGYKQVRNNGEVVFERNSKDWEISFGNGLSHVFQYSPCAKIYRSDLILNNHLQFGVGEKMEDGPFGIITSSIAKKTVVLPYCGYMYREYEESTMGKIRAQGISKEASKQQFPYKGIENAIKTVEGIRGEEYHDVLAFVVIKALAGFAFLYSKNSGKDTVRSICEYADRIIRTYFPDYKKNPYIRLRGAKGLPLSHRAAVSLFCLTYRFHCLYPFARLCAKFTQQK